MTSSHRNEEILRKYIPADAVPQISQWIFAYDFKLKIKKERSSKLGDYRAPHKGSNHIISINYNLNPYAFLITLVHEIAHLSTFNRFRDSVLPHGEEWKSEFRKHMEPFFHLGIFPSDLMFILARYLRNPAAASCSDHQLLRVLKKYDTEDKNGQTVFLETLPYKSVFLYRDHRVFIKGERIRTRFRCKELATGHYYLFNPLTEVEPFNEVEKQASGA